MADGPGAGRSGGAQPATVGAALRGRPPALRSRARDTAATRRANRSGGLAVASITLWEIAMLAAAGRLRIRGTVESWLQELLERTRVATREITPAIAALAVQFPDDFLRDPADRLIAATARAEGLALITRDAAIRESGLIETIW